MTQSSISVVQDGDTNQIIVNTPKHVSALQISVATRY